MIIAGQGLAGSLLAWELFRLGIDFKVFDPGDGRSASRAAGGLYFPIAARKLKEMELSEVQIPLMKSTFRKIEHRLGMQFLFEKQSMKLIKEEELDLWVHAQRTNLSHLVADIIPGLQLNGVVSGYHGVIIKESGHVDVSRFTDATRAWLLQQNLIVPEKVSGSDIRESENHLIIKDCYRTRKLIFCEGPAAVANPYLASGTIRRNKGELIELEAPGLQSDFILRRDIFVLPTGNGRFRAGATFSHDFQNYDPSAEGLQELILKLEQIINVPYAITNHWAGLRPTTRDRLPVFGPITDKQNMFILNGLGSRGIIQGPWYVQEMVKMLTIKV